MRLKVSNQILEPGMLWILDIDQDVDWTVPYHQLFKRYFGFNEYNEKMAKFKLENRIDIIIDTDTLEVFCPRVEQRDMVKVEMNKVLLDEEPTNKEDNPIEYVDIVKGVAQGMIFDQQEYERVGFGS